MFKKGNEKKIQEERNKKNIAEDLDRKEKQYILGATYKALATDSNFLIPRGQRIKIVSGANVSIRANGGKFISLDLYAGGGIIMPIQVTYEEFERFFIPWKI